MTEQITSFSQIERILDLLSRRKLRSTLYTRVEVGKNLGLGQAETVRDKEHTTIGRGMINECAEMAQNVFLVVDLKDSF